MAVKQKVISLTKELLLNNWKKIEDTIPLENILIMDKHASMRMRLITTNKTTHSYTGLKNGILIGIVLSPSTILKDVATGNKWIIGEIQEEIL